ncbi:hypothetical protein HYH02_014307 [Chlamydomonas schloesseri]|uniref:Uncharacterized protein n=1 Tax=Chlamydomonas schloesseri TaxID=2026947 RepID=A0A835VUP9_9CHLO|nr:hypothetical protein HYH02_014307 [Chlamydomonas schloesseri]|eukprot:KAG2428605.1 hypothetical protein HYH02_014307 [Chlamydomonas schloesseri]
MRAARNSDKLAAPAGAAKAPRKQAAKPAAAAPASSSGPAASNPAQMLARARACFGPDWPAPRQSMQAGVAFLSEALWGGFPPAAPSVSHASAGCSSGPPGIGSSSNTAAPPGAASSAGSSSSFCSGAVGTGQLQQLQQQEPLRRRRRLVVVPDKDVDGLSAGAVLLRTLNALIREAQQQGRPGANNVEVAVVHIGKGENVFQPHVAARLAAAAPTALVLLDMGSRGGGGPVLRLPPPPPPSPQPALPDAAKPCSRPLAEAKPQLDKDDPEEGDPGVAEEAGRGDGGFPVPTLVIDHHKPEGFPDGAVAVSAFVCPPVAPSALLTWALCAQLHPPSAAGSAWLAVLGTLGDLGEEGLGAFTGVAAAAASAAGGGGADGNGNTSKSGASISNSGSGSDVSRRSGSPGGGSHLGTAVGGAGPGAAGAVAPAGGGAVTAAAAALPELDAVYRAGRKTHFRDAVALLNAARRSPQCDVAGAWAALCAAQQPADISKGAVPGAAALRAARADLKDEMDRLAATPPRFSSDGSVALLAMDSGWQVHPLLPQRWAYRLGSQDRRGRLRAVMCSNRGYTPGRVHFSIRRAAGPGGAGVDLITLLKALVAERCALPALGGTALAGLGSRLGADFARGHPEATGGMLAAEDFAQLLLLMGFGADVAYGAAGIAVGPEQRQLEAAAAAALLPLQQAAQDAISGGGGRGGSDGNSSGTPDARSGGKKRSGASTPAGATADAKQRKLTDFMSARPKKAAAASDAS